jgi:hypothetical protein
MLPVMIEGRALAVRESLTTERLTTALLHISRYGASRGTRQEWRLGFRLREMIAEKAGTQLMIRELERRPS